jgi:hypothetical protein
MELIGIFNADYADFYSQKFVRIEILAVLVRVCGVYPVSDVGAGSEKHPVKPSGGWGRATWTSRERSRTRTFNLRGAPSPVRQAAGVSTAGDRSEPDMPRKPVPTPPPYHNQPPNAACNKVYLVNDVNAGSDKHPVKTSRGWGRATRTSRERSRTRTFSLRGAPSPVRQAAGVSTTGDRSEPDMPRKPVPTPPPYHNQPPNAACNKVYLVNDVNAGSDKHPVKPSGGWGRATWTSRERSRTRTFNLRGAPSPVRQAAGVSTTGDRSEPDMPRKPVPTPPPYHNQPLNAA